MTSLALCPPLFSEPHGYHHELGLVEAIRHPEVAIDDGYVLVGKDGRAIRCIGLGSEKIELPGYVSRLEGESWLFERAALNGRYEED